MRRPRPAFSAPGGQRDLDDLARRGVEPRARPVGHGGVDHHRFLDALDAACELLAEHPLIGRLRPALPEGVRSFPLGNYLIFYVPAADGIDVVRVIYGGRDLPGAFSGKI